LPRPETGEHVAVTVALVEDQPGGDVLPRTSALTVFSAVHRVDRFDVRRGFVDEPLSTVVDHDAARSGTFGEREPRPAGERERRSPPRVVHEVDGAANLHARIDAVTGRGFAAG